MAKKAVIKEMTAAEKQRNYSMKILTQVSSIDHIDWGWSSYEDRVQRAARFLVFDGIIAFLSIIQFYLVCYAAAFDPFSSVILGITYTLDVFFALDIAATVIKCYTSDIRNVEMRKTNSKLMTYLKSYYILDMLGLLPLDIVVTSCATSLGTTTAKYAACVMPKLAWSRVNRLISGYKIFRFLFKLEAKVGLHFVAIRTVYYITLSLVLLHVSACIWYVIPCSDYSHVVNDLGGIQVYCQAPSWIYSGASQRSPSPSYGPGYHAYGPGLTPKPNWNIYAGIFDHGEGNSEYLLSLPAGLDIVRLNATVPQRYYYALYWAINTMTSAGLGEVHGITPEEMLFIIIAQLTGMILVFGVVEGSITAMLINGDAILFRYKHRIMAIRDYLCDQNQSTQVVKHVVDFYNYLWQRSSGMSNAGLFDQLPFALRSDIAMELCGRIIERSPLFSHLDMAFVRMLSLRFQPMLALPEQIIMQKGELSDLMVYIQNGELEVLSDDENEVPVLLLRPGKLFGEINLITRMPRRYSVRAIAHCDLVVLRTEDLMDCLQSYPEIANELRQRAEERTGVYQYRVQEGLPQIDNQEAAKRRKEVKELSRKMRELEEEIGVNLRPLMTALNIARPQETLKVSDSIELFKIRDPMDEMVEYNMGSMKQQFRSRFRRMRQTFYDLSIDPDGLFHYFWQRCLIFMVIVTFFVNTYVGFFQSYRSILNIVDQNCPRNTTGDLVETSDGAQAGGVLIILVDYIMDVFFIVDYCLKFVTQIKTANGKITDHRTMALTYLRSWGCYTDFFAVFPIEIFAVAAVSSATDCNTLGVWDLLGYLKVNRALRVLTLPQFFDSLSDDLNNSITFVRRFKCSLYLAMLTQVCAVALYMTACDASGCSDSSEYSWTGNRPQPYIIPERTLLDPGGLNGTVSYRYTSSLYFAVVMMTTVGYGDVYPKNVVEQIVVNIVTLVGVLTYGYCLAVLTATIANLDAPRLEFQTRLFALINYMESNKLSQTIQQRVIDSLALLWTVSEGEDIPGVKSMTIDMPEHLMEDIQVDDLVHLVAGVPIFKNIEERILKRLAPAVRRYMFSPDDVIIQTGDLIPELFVIRRGFCHVFHPDQMTTVIAVLHPGMYFGEIGFLFNRNEVVTVKTITHCEVVALPRAAFDNIAVHTEWLNNQVNNISQERQYYHELISAAKNAKTHVRRRKVASPTRMSEAEKCKLRFWDDLNVAQISPFKKFIYRALARNTIPAGSQGLMIWETVRVVACIVQFILTWIQIAFQFEQWAFFGVLYVLDFHAIVDIYVKFHVQYTNDMNVVVTHPYMTARRYIQSNFWVDLFCVFPFEVFCLLPVGVVFTKGRSEILHWIMYISLNRLFHIYRLPLAFAYLETNIKVDTSRLIMVKYCTYFVLFITIVTCLPLTVQCTPLPCAFTNDGCYFPFSNNTQTDLAIQLDIDYSHAEDDDVSDWYLPPDESQWLNDTIFATTATKVRRLFQRVSVTDKTAAAPRHRRRIKRDTSIVTTVLSTVYGPIDADGHVNIDNSTDCMWQSYLSTAYGIDSNNHDVGSLIVASLYWAVTTTTTTGFGDIHATNQNEQIIFLVVMMKGVLFYGYIIACLAAKQTNKDAPRARFYERLVTIKKFMEHEHLPKYLQQRVVQYYEYLWLRTQGAEPQGLIAGLPPSLTGDLALQLYRKVIEQIPIFKNTPLGFKKMMATIIRPLYILEGEYVTRIGDIGADLFFLYRGSVEIQYRQGDFSPTIVRSGRILGEVAFLTNQKAKTSFRARENSDLFYLSKNEFDLVLDHFPDVRDKLMDEAQDSMQLEADHCRLFEARPRRTADNQSMAMSFKPQTRATFKNVFKDWQNRVFGPNDSSVRYFHKFTVNGCRIISVIIIWYQAGFSNVDLTYYGFFVINYILEVVFILDLVITQRVGFLDEFGNEVLEPARIRQRYSTSPGGLAADVLSLFPYEVFAPAAPKPLQLITWAYLRLLRTPSRLFQIRSFFRSWVNELDTNILVVRLTHSFTLIALWLHGFACLAYFIGDCSPLTFACTPDTSWLQNTILANVQGGKDTFVAKYIISLYWICNSVTSTGYGDMVALSTDVRIFSIFVQLVGHYLSGSLVVDVSSALANAGISRQNFEGQFRTMKKYLNDQQANKAIIARVQNYFNFLWTVSRGVNDINSILMDAPFCLRTEIGYAVHHRDLRELSLFRDSSDAFIRMLSACLHQVQFVPGDYVIQQGDLVQEMYFLHRGEAVEVETGVEIDVNRHGSHVNWQAVLIDWPASRTVRATDNCEVYVLSRADLEAVVAKFHHEMDLVCSATRTKLYDLLEEERQLVKEPPVELKLD